MNGPQNLSVNAPPPHKKNNKKHVDELSCVSFMSIHITAIRSLYRHVVCNRPISCKFYGIGNKLGEW